MHIAVDKETIVAMKVTKEYVHDGRKMPLVKQVKNVNVSSVIADGA